MKWLKRNMNLNQNKMGTLVLVIIGFLVGYGLGWLHDNITKKVNGKQEVDDYMKKTYGDNWWKLKSESCSCNDGVIVCPGCDGEKQSEFGVCAGCTGKGKVTCGKCGGKNKSE